MILMFWWRLWTFLVVVRKTRGNLKFVKVTLKVVKRNGGIGKKRDEWKKKEMNGNIRGMGAIDIEKVGMLQDLLEKIM